VRKHRKEMKQRLETGDTSPGLILIIRPTQGNENNLCGPRPFISHGTSSSVILSAAPHFFSHGHFLLSRVQGHRQLSPVMQGSCIRSSF
jgi:hypothetical protein